MIQSIVVGEKTKLAIEYVESPQNAAQGMLFLYVNGIRFGEDKYYFDVDSMIVNTLANFDLGSINLPGLFLCPTEDLFYSLDLTLSIEDGESPSHFGYPATKYMPDFADRLSEVDDCIFRCVHYAFDQCQIVLIPSASKLRVCVREFGTGKQAEVVTTIGEFVGLWEKLAMARGLKQSSRSP